jgi:hypothetical protein
VRDLQIMVRRRRGERIDEQAIVDEWASVGRSRSVCTHAICLPFE